MIAREGHRSFLQAHGWGAAAVAPLAGDASFRRYFRVTDGDRCAVLMDAPPAQEDVRPFLRIADLLLRAGFSAPRLIAGDLVQGFLLIEDFGDRLVRSVVEQQPADEPAIYAAAVDLLVELHRMPPPLELQPYDRAVLEREALLFAQWYMPAADLQPDEHGFLAAWSMAWSRVLAETDAASVVVLRDYHAENLMLLADRPGVQRLGLLDFQDALAGHRAYDLVSLLQDARRDVPAELERAMLARFIAHAGVEDPTAFRAAYEVLGAQRNTKILGIFVRLRDRDGRAGYVERLPRVWAHLERNLTHPALAPVRAWFDANVPQSKRSAWCR